MENTCLAKVIFFLKKECGVKYRFFLFENFYIFVEFSIFIELAFDEIIF
jgi:hypothetical protein